jgi:hypothetical protein
MSRKLIAIVTSLLLLSICASVSRADDNDWKSVRKPLGVYAHLDIALAIKELPDTCMASAAEVHGCLRSLYAGILSNAAISGLATGAHWDAIQLSDPPCFFNHSCSGTLDGYDWSYLDDVFAEANLAHKTVQLIITPGVDAPQWLLDKIPSCDGLFTTGSAPANCGKVTFVNFPEVQRADGNPPVQPLPWNPIYNLAWWDFLVHLNVRYNSNPAFVSIAVAGPVCASDEFILPTTANGSTQLNGLVADHAWNRLIEHSFPFQADLFDTDQVFIDAWKATIDAYQVIFHGVTLFLAPDSGNDMPEYSESRPPHRDNILFAVDCSSVNNEVMSCEAKTEVLSYFVKVEGPNQKSTQVGGMTAGSLETPGDIGIAGVKVLTSLPPPAFFIGGAEFDFAVSSTNTQLQQQQGCPKFPVDCGDLTVEVGAYNTLTVFFYGTPAAAFYGGAVGAASIQYLGVDYTDVIYAQKNLCAPTPKKSINNMSLQDLLNKASHDLFAMAGQNAPLPPLTCK